MVCFSRGIVPLGVIFRMMPALGLAFLFTLGVIFETATAQDPRTDPSGYRAWCRSQGGTIYPYQGSIACKPGSRRPPKTGTKMAPVQPTPDYQLEQRRPSSDVSPPSDSYSSSDLSSVTGIATASVIEEDYPIKKELLGEEWKYRKAVMDALACDLHCQTPYKMGGRWKVPLSCSCEGSRELGRDCSGLVAGAYRQGVCLLKGFYKSSFDRLSFLETDAKGLSIYFAKNGAFIHPKSGVEPSPGDVIFFKKTYKKGVSHVGIFVGKNKNGETVIIHASSSGVTGEPISDYLKDKVAGYGNISRLYSKHVMTFHP